MLTTETQQGFGLKSKDMKMQTPSNERRISQKSNHTAVLVHIPMFWNRSEKKKIKNQRKISMGDLFKDIQPVYLIDSLLNLFKKGQMLLMQDSVTVRYKACISYAYAYCPSHLM